MRNLILTAFLSLPLYAAFSARIGSSGPTAAVLVVKEASGACTVTLRERGPGGPIHPDWPGVADTTKPDTLVDGTTRRLLLGHFGNNFDLAAGMDYHVTISGCGSSTLRFRTPNAVSGMTMGIMPPFDASHWHNAAYPKVDWSAAGQGKWYTDPTTGIRLKMMPGPEDFTWADKTDKLFSFQAGGTGWTNTATIINGTTSTAQTSGTNPVFLYVSRPGENAWTGYGVSHNIGVIPWAQCVSGTGEDCKIEVMLFKNPGTLPAPGTNIIEFTAGGSMTSVVPGGSTYAYTTGAFPVEYPRPHWAGWSDGGAFSLTQDMTIPDTAVTTTTIVSGLVTIAPPNGPTIVNNIQRALSPGSHVWVNAPAAVTNCTAAGTPGICTVETNASIGSMQLVETISPPNGTTIKGLPWGIAIRKKTATGTVRVGLKYRMSGGLQTQDGTRQPTCSYTPVVRSDGVRGSACFMITQGSLGKSVLYFIPEDDDLDPVPIDGLGDPAALENRSDNCVFDNRDPRTIYCTHNTGLRRAHYNGDWGETPTIWQRDPTPADTTAGARYAHEQNGFYKASIYSYPAVNPTMTWTMLLPTAEAQIRAMAPGQLDPPYEAWTPLKGVAITGTNGPLLIQHRVVNHGQDDGPCQIAVWNMDIAGGTLIDFINTGAQPGTPLNYGECHTVQAGGIHYPAPLGFMTSFNYAGKVRAPSTSLLLHGPHLMDLVAVRRSGSWSTNLVLNSPMTDTAYDRTCPTVGTGPGQIPQEWKDLGANNDALTSGGCVTLRVRGTTAAKAVCNKTPKGAAGKPGTGDFQLFGTCEWNSAYAGSPGLEVGMQFYDWDLGFNSVATGGASNGSGGDTEHFRIMSITPEGGFLTLVVQRNASRMYCCVRGTTNPPGTIHPATPGCATQEDTQATHGSFPDNDGVWHPAMLSGAFGGCNVAGFVIDYPDPTNGSSRRISQIPSHYVFGHANDGTAVDGSLAMYAALAQRNFRDVVEMSTQPPLLMYPRNQTWDNQDLSGGLQQYVSHQHRFGPASLQYLSGDVHVYASSGSPNNFTNTVSALARQGNIFQPVATTPPAGIWQIGTSNAQNLKSRTMVAEVGPLMLRDISNPDTSTHQMSPSTPDYTFCYAYRPGECRIGSAAGAAYIKAPWVFEHPTSSTLPHASMEMANDPVVMFLPPMAGFVRQMVTEGSQAEGTAQSLVSSFLRPPLLHNGPYWGAQHLPSGRQMIATSTGYVEGVRRTGWLASVPPLPDMRPQVRALSEMRVRVGPRPGMTHARIRFGSGPTSFGGTPKFFCMTRQEECVTDFKLTPYAFAGTTGGEAPVVSSDALTPNPCLDSTGCTLRVPSMPGRPLFYRVETFNGTAWTNEPVQVLIPTL